MVVIALSVLALFVAGVGRAYPPAQRGRAALIAALGGAAWAGLTWAAAASGRLADFEARPPAMMLLFVAILAVSFGVGLSSLGRRLAALPIAWLIGVQAFRLPLELVMHQAAAEGVMPPQMTWTGSNWDIATGATAVVVAGIAAAGRAPRWLLWAWNVLGIALLANVLVVALRSLPLFQAYGSEPRLVNTWVAHPPFVWLPAIMVAAAIAGHVVVTRRLIAART
jgi:hypothetical protein